MYVGDLIDPSGFVGARRSWIEVDINAGVQALPLSANARYHTRVGRPFGLERGDPNRLCDLMLSRLGYPYDVRTRIDLIRYIIQRPPVPSSWRRRMLELRSGDPTRAICSWLIARAFPSIHYPLMPDIQPRNAASELRDIHDLPNPTLHTARNVDVWPFFDTIKPRIATGFDFHGLDGGDEPPAIAGAAS